MVSERAKLHTALTFLQFCHAGNHIFLRIALNTGVSKLVFPVYRNITAFILLAPLAYFTEKKDRPPITSYCLLQFFLLGLVGITMKEGFYLVGLDNTSPTFASAMQNSVPALTFLMAVILRYESLRLNRINGIAKVLGVVASVGGFQWEKLELGWHISLWSLFELFGTIAAFLEKDPKAWQLNSIDEAYSILYSGVVISGVAAAIQIWTISKGGPVLASIYLPLQTLLVALIASIAFGEEFFLGGIVGAILIITGLYLVVWGRSQETKSDEPENRMEEKIDNSYLIQPLISVHNS
ncbi:unnamed protein product [Vicia faba]|uniref:WAT1-related protein n=1 Tax=Vicia faba TaxID=3906 RepID=A0AAV0YRA3_VICFA|nr:unnamed protein product [Vicia faba]